MSSYMDAGNTDFNTEMIGYTARLFKWGTPMPLLRLHPEPMQDSRADAYGHLNEAYCELRSWQETYCMSAWGSL